MCYIRGFFFSYVVFKILYKFWHVFFLLIQFWYIRIFVSCSYYFSYYIMFLLYFNYFFRIVSVSCNRSNCILSNIKYIQDSRLPKFHDPHQSPTHILPVYELLHYHSFQFPQLCKNQTCTSRFWLLQWYIPIWDSSYALSFIFLIMLKASPSSIMSLNPISYANSKP